MKNKRAIFLMSLACFLTGCSENVVAPNNANKMFVSLIDNDHISFNKQQVLIDRGEDAVFEITIEDNYSISNVSYENYGLFNLGANKYRITFRGLESSTRIEINVITESSIRYHANGGKLKHSDEDYYTLTYNFDIHKRLNTSLGNNYLQRDNYTLIGWNTKADGTGEHIGLGSRVTLNTDDYLDLYAQWVKETDTSKFDYRKVGNQLCITKYNGNDSLVAIPKYIDGSQVIQIDSYAFNDNQDVTTVVCPYTLGSIARDAFNNCDSLEEIYFYDNLRAVTNTSFKDCDNFKTLHINAEHNPCYANLTRHRHYADKIDMLILSQEKTKPRMLFMSGSSMWFSLEGEQVEAAFDSEYTIINVALNSFFASIPQFDVLCHFLKEGDVFVHAPEICSEQELMYTNEMNIRMWQSFELNYDLFSYVDIRKCSSVFSSFVEFNDARQELEQFDYESTASIVWIDEYGCIPFTRPEVNGDEDLLDGARIGTDLLTETAWGRLNTYYDEIYSITKNKVMFGYGPINYDGLPENERNEDVWRSFEVRCEEMITDNAYIINTVSSSVFRGRLFYYTNYHLGTEASKIWTKTLTDGIRKGLGYEEN